MDPAQVLVLLGVALVAVGALGVWWTRSPAPAPRGSVRRRPAPIPELLDSAWVTTEGRDA